jgi:hypothetical protein
MTRRKLSRARRRYNRARRRFPQKHPRVGHRFDVVMLDPLYARAWGAQDTRARLLFMPYKHQPFDESSALVTPLWLA